MSATTIKLEGELLKRLQQVKPSSLSVSAYVRSLIEGDLRRQALAAAARAYQEFLAAAETERDWLDEWTRADLVKPPTEKSR